MKCSKKEETRYIGSFLKNTENKICSMNKSEFIHFLEKNAVLEDEDSSCKTYILREENSNLKKEFIVTNNGSVFYYRTLNHKIELIDSKENKEVENV